MNTSPRINPTLGMSVKVTGSDSPTIDQSFVGLVGKVTAIYPPGATYSGECYQVTLPDGRHDMFFDDELTEAAQ